LLAVVPEGSNALALLLLLLLLLGRLLPIPCCMVSY
jgi:hypothetical protein